MSFRYHNVVTVRRVSLATDPMIRSDVVMTTLALLSLELWLSNCQVDSRKAARPNCRSAYICKRSL